jgi:hypothetical protein
MKYCTLTPKICQYYQSVVSRYYNYCTDDSTSAENYGYPSYSVLDI